MARSTPAQNERGPASSTWRGRQASAHRASAGPASRSDRSAAMPPGTAPAAPAGAAACPRWPAARPPGGRSPRPAAAPTPCPRPARRRRPAVRAVTLADQVVHGDDRARPGPQPGPAQLCGQQRRGRAAHRRPSPVTSVPTTRSPGLRSAVSPRARPAHGQHPERCFREPVGLLTRLAPRRSRCGPRSRRRRPRPRPRPRRMARASNASGEQTTSPPGLRGLASSRRLMPHLPGSGPVR